MKKILTFVLLALLLACGASPVYAVPALPHAFYGSVSVNNAAAADGTQVSATVSDGTISPTQNPVFTVGGSYGVDQPKLLVQGEIPPGAVITFHVTNANGTAVGGTYVFEAGGGPTRVDLSVSISAPSTPTGGGGGGTGQFLSDANYCGKQTKFWITAAGKIVNTFTAGCEGGPLTITVKKNTVALDKEGKPLKLLSIEENLNPPDPPAGANIITIPYTLEPSGATFDPALTFTWQYDELPEGADEDSLVIAFWNGKEWVYFDCDIDTDAKTITAKVSHFTTFAALVFVPEEEEEEVIEPPTPAAFLLSSLLITPPEVELGETVTISVMVQNTGETAGSYDVILELDGEESFLVYMETVELDGGATQSVTFVITLEEAGAYTVAMDELADSFTVIAPTVTEPDEEEEEEEEVTPFPWWIIIIVILIIAVSVIWIWYRRRL